MNSDTQPTPEALLERLRSTACYSQQVEQELAKLTTPELETIMKLHRLLILKLSTQAELQPELWDVLKDLLKSVLDWGRLQEQQKEREFAQQKYREQLEAKKAEEQAEQNRSENESLAPNTLELIELELKLL